ncbi:branched-chain amino acid ABC transporter permease [Microbaculum marinum]|uniref:Branched-chain amino acid ABC transporter permease n=1 Tax=Microbaculum marinum TaxID=1764581 RepID=A0AAW9RKL7_9HYPH
MYELFHQILTGLSQGGIYGGLALGLVMVYRTTHHVNFAQGEFAMFSTFLALTLIQAGFSYWSAFFLTIAISFAGGMAVERIVIRPFHQASALTLVCVFMGLLMVTNATAGWLFGYTMQPFPSPFSDAFALGGFIPAHEAGTILLVALMLLLIYLFFRFTWLGLAMRATAENGESSALVGINVGAMLALGWGLATGIGAVAGMMAAPIVFVDPNMMSGVLVYAFAAALLGGIDNPWGAAISGFIVGVVENIAGAYLVGTELKLTLALAIIVGVLLIRPRGIWGRSFVTRV